MDPGVNANRTQLLDSIAQPVEVSLIHISIKSNFNFPSDALPGPVHCQSMWSHAGKSGGEQAVVGYRRNVGSSVVQSNVKLWLCASIVFTYAAKSRVWILPFVPQSWRLFQV